ncbi:O-antigen ligase family protein [Pareuzebyella sediminis]|uniref:O-antigen ligase family protein n=1 Tax=Pareuzebyella sediminis TaxID=2607998 RepID=UPI0018E12157|nr:O-antigen ligase family protein [Pareuzebyella sediminis]
MRESWLTVDLRNVPKLLFLIILLFYSLFDFLVYESSGAKFEYLFGAFCLVLLTLRLFCQYRKNVNIVIPHYILFLAAFIIYTSLTGIFVSDLFIEKGAFKYFYSNSFIMMMTSFLFIENTYFPRKWIDGAINILGLVLIVSAIVSVIQVFEPLFLMKDRSVIEGLSYDRLLEYYDKNPEEKSGSVSRLFQGYRFSIYSHVSAISVGIDGLAIYSLLFALKSKKTMKTSLWVFAAALVSFLSSSRWIMLNFLLISSQKIWTKNNRILNFTKYFLFGILLLIILVFLLEFFGINFRQFVEERLADDSASTRLLALEVFSKVFPEHPFLGTGGVSTEEVQQLLAGRSSQIHVGYLKLFYYHGLIGGILYLTFLFSFLKRMWKMSKISNYWGGFFAILAFAVANLTLVEFSLFYHGLLLALVFTNHFYHERTKNIFSVPHRESSIRHTIT